MVFLFQHTGYLDLHLYCIYRILEHPLQCLKGSCGTDSSLPDSHSVSERFSLKVLWKPTLSGEIQIYWKMSAVAVTHQPPEMDVLSFQTNCSLDLH